MVWKGSMFRTRHEEILTVLALWCAEAVVEFIVGSRWVEQLEPLQLGMECSACKLISCLLVSFLVLVTVLLCLCGNLALKMHVSQSWHINFLLDSYFLLEYSRVSWCLGLAQFSTSSGGSI